MSQEKGYNGWSNYETWNVKLWIDNDEGSYEYWRERTLEAWGSSEEDCSYPSQTREDSANCILAAALKDEHEENTPTVTGVYADLLNAALSAVDWHEIATAMIEDEELKDDEEETEESEAS